jgi:hypothetical protein
MATGHLERDQSKIQKRRYFPFLVPERNLYPYTEMQERDSDEGHELHQQEQASRQTRWRCKLTVPKSKQALPGTRIGPNRQHGDEIQERRDEARNCWHWVHLYILSLALVSYSIN